jgi:hypothetical protein
VNPDSLMVISNSGFNAIRSAAGTFDIASETFSLTNADIAPLDWSIVNTSAWLNASITSGTLAPGAGTLVTISLNNVASNLNAGTYTASIWFSNVTSSVAHSRFFTLKASNMLVIQPTNNFSFISPAGGPFAPTLRQVTLTNAHSSAISWSINNPSSWFNVSPMSGNLLAGAQSNVTITLTPAVTNLPNGTYTATLQLTNLSNLSVQTITGKIQVGQPLIANGGFETGDFTSWTLNGDAGYFDLVDSGTYITPHSGSYAAALGEANFLAYLSQTISTVAGQKYLISLWMENPLAGSSHNPNEFSVSWNGNTLYDKSNIGKTGWTNMQFIVVATGASAIVKIGGRNDRDYIGLDDVTVTPGFAPSISTQPTNQTISVGDNVTFNVVATGLALKYQWQKNGINVSGATTNSLTFTATTSTNSGNYSVVITNTYGSVTSAVATLTVNLQTPVLTLLSSENPAGFKENLNFTATLTPANATGSIQFFTNGIFFDSKPLVAGNAASIFISVLPRGDNQISAIYSGDQNNFPVTNAFVQIVTNHPPEVIAFYTKRFAGLPLKIPVANLSSNWSDMDGDAISLVDIGISTNGVIVTNNSGTLVYCNSNSVDDDFVCTVSDGWGGTNFQEVHITFWPLPTEALPVITSLVNSTNHSILLNLTGAAGFTYILETTTNSFSEDDWQPAATNVLGESGLWQVSDATTNGLQKFYRLKLAQ